MDLEKENIKVPFTVDAGIINRLGQELVAKEATAVSELVKNSYDADAREVTLLFEDAETHGGILTIEDDGHGMTYDQLVNGFLKIASADKINNPISPTYKRKRAGRKGIGRFATQRLGEKLTILTQTKDAKFALKLTVNWDKYTKNKNLNEILNSVEYVDRFKYSNSGTTIFIENLRDKWSKAKIKRVFRYISDLLQPSFLSELSKDTLLGNKDENNYFNVTCIRSLKGELETIDTDSVVFDSAIAVIKGKIKDGKAICKISSEIFDFESELNIDGDFSLIENTHFLVYYFIFGFEAFDRYYKGRITKTDFNQVREYCSENGGVRVYRNGFRVLPYGEEGNDWLSLDKAYLKTSENAYVPINNKSLIGFVEINDVEEQVFEETASREGLIENNAFKKLTTFLINSLRNSTKRVNMMRLRHKRLEELKKINRTRLKEGKNTLSQLNDLISSKEKSIALKVENKENVEADDYEVTLLKSVRLELEEAELLRVLAGVGLTIAEFTHEVRQFIPIFKKSIKRLLGNNKLDFKDNKNIVNLNDSFNRFNAYIGYIDQTVRDNVSREKFPIVLNNIVSDFVKTVKPDAIEHNIDIKGTMYGFDLTTIPMHPSEWHSILYNLYTNAKKAIQRAKVKNGKIELIGGCEDGKIYLEFTDNGGGIDIGVKEFVFDAFFTTADKNYVTSKPDSVIGTGLGLKIVKDIIEGYKGTIELIKPETGFSTCFRIEVPQNNKLNYG